MESNNDMTPDERRRLIDSIPTVSVVDSCKENIQPRRSGRSASALTTLFDTSEREHQLQVGHTQFQEQLEKIDEQDDPLDTYIRYIAWITQMYPQNNADSNLMNSLKDATDKFKNDRRYKYDPRYLKIWLELAGLVHEPREIFHNLINRDIGQTLSLFYEEYSAYYEKLKKYDEAIQVYELGISKEADPIKRLKRNFTLLQSRIEERQQRGLMRRQQQEAQRQMQGLRQTGQRTMLGERVDSRPDVSLPSNVHRGLGLGGSTSSLGRRATFGTFGNDRPTPVASTPSSPSSSFSVYVEPTSEPARSFNSILPSSSTLPNDKLHISQNPLFKAENQGYKDKTGGSSPIPQQEISREVPVATYKVYRDPEEPKSIKRSASSPHMLSSTRTTSTIVSPRVAELFHHHSSSISGNARAESSRAAVESLQSRSTSTTITTAAVEYNRSSSTVSAADVSTLTRSDPPRIRKNPPASTAAVPHTPKKRPRRQLGHDMILDAEALTPRYLKMKHVYHRTMDTQGYEEMIAVKWENLKKHQNMSIEEIRAKTLKLAMQPHVIKKQESEDAFQSYYKSTLQDEIGLPEYTTETRNAMKIVGSIFNNEQAYTEDEKDLTWENPVQKFEYKKPKPVNENE